MRKKSKPPTRITPEAQRICRAWAEIMKAELSPSRVAWHLDMLDRWDQAKRKDLEKKNA
jgi:hypothetical protein